MEREIRVLAKLKGQEVAKLTFGRIDDQEIELIVAALKSAYGPGHQITETMRRTHCDS